MKKKYIVFSILIYVLFSFSSVFMKYASSEENVILKFVFFGCSIGVLGIFSLLWQKLLNKTDLSKAYMFKSTTLIWSLIYGIIFFGENVTMNKILGIIITMIGIVTIIGESKND